MLRVVGAAVLAAAAGASLAQTTGDSNAGQQLFTTTLSPQCSGCHSATNAAAANSLTIIRDRITARSTTAGAAGTLSFAKALEALDRALTGTALSGSVTGMNGFYTLTATQRGDLAAFIAGIAGPAPVLRYAPASGPIFPATAVGATAASTVTITNAGTADLVFVTNNAVTLASGGQAADFRVTTSNCLGITLRPNTGNCTINVEFRPTSAEPPTRTASLGLTTTTGTSLVPLAGSVSVSAAAPTGSSAANAPAAGGGGAVPWQLIGIVLLATLRSPRRSGGG